MIILDTNVISEAAKLGINSDVETWLNIQPVNMLYATAISLAEISLGIEKLPDGRRKNELRHDMEQIFGRYFGPRILPFDREAAVAYGRLVALARANGKTILMADGQIAAIAQVHSFAVATRDTAPFEAAGIPVINPWKL
ncbi:MULTISPECIES: type II toxin-antitoxin system VapC family toxin [Neorhizobium]|uniref:Ribonuclease VapC n=1 Tax=Neorhizobium galegae bv. officinalis TaxID=323656 RepID=A0A0T7GTI9_NEOGA|nr:MULTISPECIES: type II toxin-antitoxin system VapC family toxin [Neorhizobium]CDZ50601.1 Probable ribonuclease VapC [Neorhizobium galegae bv. officinalis]